MLEEVKKNGDIYQYVGMVFKQMGPGLIPILVEAVRTDSQGAWHPVWYALREMGTLGYLGLRAAAAIDTFRKTEDDRFQSISRDAREALRKIQAR